MSESTQILKDKANSLENLKIASKQGRYFYGLTFAVISLLIFIGFARTYYLKAVFGTRALPSLLHIHGFVMTTWLLIFGFQIWLVRQRRVRWHRRVGMIAAFWAALALVVGAMTAIATAKKSPTDDKSSLIAMAIPMGDLVAFGGLLSAGLWFRNRPETHRRLMLLSSISLLPPAIGRFPIHFLDTKLGFLGLTDIVLLACVIVDTANHRRLHGAFLWGGLFLIATQPLRLALSTTPAWILFASWLVHRKISI